MFVTVCANAGLNDKNMMPDNTWCVYIIETDDDRLYTGITNDLVRRWQAHMSRKNGAKFFRGRKPLRVVYVEPAADRSCASKREAQIKRLRRCDKLALVSQPSADLNNPACESNQVTEVDANPVVLAAESRA